MICTSIADHSFAECLTILETIEFAEIRLDRCAMQPAEVERLFALPGKRLIACCRPGAHPEAERRAVLLKAIASGAVYVDVEVESDAGFCSAIVDRARDAGCQVIISFHDYEKTPEPSELERIVADCFARGADIAKVACMVNTERDNARLLGLLDSDQAIVPIGMGGKGRITRVASLRLGAPFTYAALDKGQETAAGQWTREEMEQWLDSTQL